jgi:hypothetical protein
MRPSHANSGWYPAMGWSFSSRAVFVGLVVAAATLIAGAPGALADAPCGTAGVFARSGTTVTCTYASPGTEDTFTVPDGVSALNVTAIGARGGAGNNSSGALGAKVTNAALPVTSGTQLSVDVGAPGPNFNCAFDPGGAFDGGTAGFCSGAGGGSSALLTSPRSSATLTGNAATDSRLLVAGGGGGGGQTGNNGGSAGDANITGGGSGGCASTGGTGGVGPTDGTTGGGAAGCGANAAAGTASGGGQGSNAGAGGGGGGGGWFGGGGGGTAGGGGGGSSYGGAGPTSGISVATASPTDQPEVIVSYTLPEPTASIAAPANGATYTQGQAVTSSFSCTEATGGPGLTSCLDQNGNPSGAAIDTSTPGQHTFTVTATSSDGLAGQSSVTYTVTAVCQDAAGASKGGFDSGFNAGFNAGFKAGFDSGFKDGFKSGFKRGFRGSRAPAVAAQANQDPCSPIFDKGFASGFNSGFNAGFDSGFASGFRSGFRRGYRAGKNKRHHHHG